MELKVIGAGFGRTGTLSLKAALERLGFGPCYHMREVITRAEHVRMWHKFVFGGPMDWDYLFRDFQATVDWPAARWWREIAAHFPNAKVLLTVRPAHAWYKSMLDTIYPPMRSPAPATAPEELRMINEMVRKAILTDTFEDRFEARDHAIAVFDQHVSEVCRTIEPKRLLVFNVNEGWEPLCKFLGVSVPSEPFPKLNDTASTQAMIRQRTWANNGA